MNENLTSLEKDSVSRDRIVSEIERNFFVEAGAGSGKTSMLVRRMVAMVEAGKDISKISAITFTKAAAGEKQPERGMEGSGLAGTAPGAYRDHQRPLRKGTPGH